MTTIMTKTMTKKGIKMAIWGQFSPFFQYIQITIKNYQKDQNDDENLASGHRRARGESVQKASHLPYHCQQDCQTSFNIPG